MNLSQSISRRIALLSLLAIAIGLFLTTGKNSISFEKSTVNGVEKESVGQAEITSPPSTALNSTTEASNSTASKSETAPLESPLLRSLQVVAKHPISKFQDGRINEYLLESKLKNRWLRYRQEIETKGNIRRETESAWVADHYIVRKHPSVDGAIFESELENRGYAVQLKLSLADTYIVAAPAPPQETEAVDDAFQMLLELSDLVSHAERDYVQRAAIIDEPDLVSGKQWPLENTGSTGGVSGSDIDALAAWELVTDASSVVVAVIDTGVNYLHDDLIANIWSNSGEIPDDGIDNDNNGYVDDLYGIDTYNNDSDPGDDNGHGTHCAGIIGADGNNDAGITGVAPSVQIMSLKFLSSTGVGFTSDALEVIDYAKNNGADILNLSWGSSSYSELLESLLHTCGQEGIIVVASAGNDGDNIDNRKVYPASYDLGNLLTVSATDDTDQLAAYSNYGPYTVEISAPGTNVYSTWTGSTNAYSILSGTSMAAPHAAGALALVRSLHPAESPFSSITRLLNGAEAVPQLQGRIAQARRLNLYGALTGDIVPENDSVAAAYQSDLHAAHWSGANLNANESSFNGALLENCVWYAWTPPESGRSIFEFNGTLGLRSSVFKKTSATTGVTHLNDLASGRYGLNVTQGETYLIAIYGEAPGDFTIDFSVSPVNDEQDQATALNGESWRVTGSNLGATLSAGESGLNYGSDKSVWWEWTAPKSGALKINTVGSDFDTVLTVYSENPLDGIIQGTEPDILFVIDVSGSSKYKFDGNFINDINGDGSANTILDAEVAAISNIINQLKAQPNPETKTVTLIAFNGSATTIDLNPVAPGNQSTIPLGSDADNNGIDDTIQALLQLRAGGATNFENALQASVNTFQLLETAAGNGNVVFFSDGHPNGGGSFTDEVATLKANQVLIRAFGAGIGASLGSLQAMDPLARIYSNEDELKQMISGALAYNDDHQGELTSEVNLSVIAGQKYFIRVDGYDGESGTIQLYGNMYDGLEVVNEPVSQQVERGTDALLSVTVRGIPPIQYQWFRDGEYIPEARSPQLLIPRATQADAASYYVRISNTFTSIDSQAAVLGVFDNAPSLITQPQSRKVTTGSNVTLTAGASGTPPLDYQWYKDEELLSGATSPNLIIDGFQSVNEGSYHVVVTNTIGSVSSSAAYVEESPTPYSDWRYTNISGPSIGGAKMAFHGEHYYVFGQGRVHRTRDGAYWDIYELPDNKDTDPDGGVVIKSVASIGNTIVVYATRGFDEWYLFASDDGKNWREINIPGIRFYSIAAYGGKWVSFGIHDGDFAIMTSEDLESWARVESISAYTNHLLVPAGSEWSYLADGVPASSGPEYYHTTFDDSSWPRGRAELGYGDGDETTVIPNAPSNDRVYFRHAFTNPLRYTSYYFSGRVKYDDEAIIRFGNKVLFSDWDGDAATAKPEGFEDTWQDIDENGLTNLSSSQSTTYFTAEVFKSGGADTDLSFDAEIWGRVHHGLIDPVASDERIIVMRRDGTVFVSLNGIDWVAETSTGIASTNSAGNPYVEVHHIVAHQGKFIAWVNPSLSSRAYYVSEDGITWQKYNFPLARRYFGNFSYNVNVPLDATKLTSAGNLLLLPSGTTLFYTSDCVTWESMLIGQDDPGASASDTVSLTNLAYHDGEYFAALGNNEYKRVTDIDDIKATTNGTKVEATHLRIMNGQLIGFERKTSGVSHESAATTDGEKWQTFKGYSPDAVFHEGTYYAIGYRNGQFEIHRETSVQGSAYDWPLEGFTPFPFTWQPLTLRHFKGKFIAAGYKGGIATSDDSINWTHLRPSSDLSGQIHHSKIINGIYFAFAENGQFFTSVDGTSYDTYTLPGISGKVTSGSYGNGFYVISAEKDGQAAFFISDDAMNWTPNFLPNIGDVKGIAFANGWFVAVADQTVLSSQDGASWTSTTLTEGSATDVAYYRNRFWISTNRNTSSSALYWQSGAVEPLSAPSISQVLIDQDYFFNSEVLVQVDAFAETGLDRVEFYLDGKLVKSTNTEPYEWRSSDVSFGPHELVVYAYTTDGAQTSSVHTFDILISDPKSSLPNNAHDYDKFLKSVDGRIFGYGQSYLLPATMGYTLDGKNWNQIGSVDTWPDVRNISDLKQIQDGTLIARTRRSNGYSTLYTSKDGIGWEKSFDNTGSYSLLVSGDDQFIILPAMVSGRIAYTSPDGLEWTPSPISYDPGNFIPLSRSLYDVIYWKNRYIGLYHFSSTVGILTSGDGLNWKGQQSLPYMKDPQLLAGENHLLAFTTREVTSGSYPNYSYTPYFESQYSSDGTAWHPLSDLTDHEFVKMSVIDGMFYGSDVNGLWRSQNLADWERVTEIDSSNDYLLKYSTMQQISDNYLVATRRLSTNLDQMFHALTKDFTEWDILQDYDSVSTSSLASDGQNLVTTVEDGLLRSTDGNSWVNIDLEITNPSVIRYNGQVWVVLAERLPEDPLSGSIIAYSTDLEQWSFTETELPLCYGLEFNTATSTWLSLSRDSAATSTNLIDWNISNGSSSEPFRSGHNYVFGCELVNGKFFLMRSDGLFHSGDGTEWVYMHKPWSYYSSLTTHRYIYYENGYYFIPGEVVHYRSSDLINWESITSPLRQKLKADAYIDGIGLGYFDTGIDISVSRDLQLTTDGGVSFIPIPTNLAIADIHAVGNTFYFCTAGAGIGELSLIDLKPDNLVVNHSGTPGIGLPVEIEFDIINLGYIDYDVPRDIDLRILMSPDSDFSDGNNIILHQETWTGTLNKDAVTHFSREALLPRNTPSGGLYVAVEIDVHNGLAELNENNNQLATSQQVLVIPVARLTVNDSPGGTVQTGNNSSASLTQSKGSSSNGLTALSGQNQIPFNTIMDLVATPTKGYVFVGWEEYPNNGITPLNLKLDSDKTLTPIFRPINEIKIEIQGQGTVQSIPTTALSDLDDGQSVSLTATPAIGWSFLEWTGDFVSSQPNITLTADGSKSIRCTFYKNSIRYEDWREEEFNVYEALDASFSDHLMDADEDRYENLLEYLFCSSAKNSADQPRYEYRFESDKVTFEHITDPRISDYSLELEYSTDLIRWYSTTATAQTSSISYRRSKVTREINRSDLPDSTAVFFRFKAKEVTEE